MTRFERPAYPCDLHVHTMASDGGYLPEILAFSACVRGMKAIAVTDHDTLASVDDTVHAGELMGLRIVPGVELTTRERYHILGYYISGEDNPLTGYLQNLRELSWRFMAGVLDELRGRGLDISGDELAGRTGKGIPNMSHLIDVLYVRGEISSYAWDGPEILELFGGDPDYMVNYFRRFAATGPFTDAAGAINLIHSAGGVAVWAHPMRAEPAEIIRLKEAGLDGLEVVTPKHDPQVRDYLNAMCQEFGLLATGGTDYHGRHFDSIERGRQIGHCGVSEQVLDRIESAASARRNAAPERS